MKVTTNITSGSSSGQRLAYHIIYGVCRLIGLLPWWFLYYPVAWVVYVLLYRVARYRRSVVRENLAASFPEKTLSELHRIERLFYRHLAEVFIDTIDLAGISQRQLERRIVFDDVAEHRRRVESQSWIAAMAHYGSWEYFMAYALGDGPGYKTIGAYKPLHNKPMDMFYKRMRSRMNMHPVPISVFTRRIIAEQREGSVMCVGLIADQSPPWQYWDKWYTFLGRPTHFYDGMETMALRFRMPVYFMHVEKTRPAHYHVRFEQIYDGREEVAAGEITRRYVRLLEEMIRRRPELWLWSHRRWKHIPQVDSEQVSE